MSNQPATIVVRPGAAGRLRRDGMWAVLWRALGRSRSTMVGGAIVLAVVLIAIFAPLLSPYDPLEIEVHRRLAGPAPAHLFGTDNLGRDILSRVIHGARISLTVGSLVGLCAAGAGSVLGLLA